MHATSTRAIPEPSPLPSGQMHGFYLNDGDSLAQKTKWEIDPRMFTVPSTLQTRVDPVGRKRPAESESPSLAPKKAQQSLTPPNTTSQFPPMPLIHPTTQSPTSLRAVPPYPLAPSPSLTAPGTAAQPAMVPSSVIFANSTTPGGTTAAAESPDVTRRLADLVSDQLQSMRTLVSMAELHTPLLAQQHSLRDALAAFSRFSTSISQLVPLPRPSISTNSNAVLTATPPGSGSALHPPVGSASQSHPSSASTVIVSPISSATSVPEVTNPPQPTFETVHMADFALLDTLGTGMFSKVRLCRHKASNQLYCLKIMSKEEIIKQKQQEHVRNEKWILSSASHPFIVRLYSTFQDHSNVYFLMEYVSGGELFSHIRRHVRLSNAVARFYTAEIILAISYLHDMDVVHRDLKPENLLLDTHGHIKLIDFGFAKKLSRQRTYSMCGTPEYIAPEVILNKGHTKSADWWSLGVLIYEMLAGQPPFFEDHNHTVFERIIENSKAPYPADFDPAARDLIEKLLVEDVDQRLGTRGAAEIKQHPWFRAVNWEHIYQRKLDGPIKPKTASGNALLTNEADTEDTFAWDTL